MHQLMQRVNSSPCGTYSKEISREHGLHAVKGRHQVVLVATNCLCSSSLLPMQLGFFQMGSLPHLTEIPCQTLVLVRLHCCNIVKVQKAMNPFSPMKSVESEIGYWSSKAENYFSPTIDMQVLLQVPKLGTALQLPFSLEKAANCYERNLRSRLWIAGRLVRAKAWGWLSTVTTGDWIWAVWATRCVSRSLSRIDGYRSEQVANDPKQHIPAHNSVTIIQAWDRAEYYLSTMGSEYSMAGPLRENFPMADWRIYFVRGIPTPFGDSDLIALGSLWYALSVYFFLPGCESLGLAVNSSWAVCFTKARTEIAGTGCSG